MNIIYKYLNKLKCHFNGHEFEYSQFCTGNLHFAARKCNICGYEDGSKRCCTKACDVYQGRQDIKR